MRRKVLMSKQIYILFEPTGVSTQTAKLGPRSRHPPVNDQHFKISIPNVRFEETSDLWLKRIGSGSASLIAWRTRHQCDAIRMSQSILIAFAID